MKRHKTFTEFLSEKHADQYRGLDDEMPDDFEAWLDDLDINELIVYADRHAVETAVGIPEWLARLEDTIFEGLKNGHAKAFAVDFLVSVPVGINLEAVKWIFCAFILKENIDRVLSLNINDKLKQNVVKAIRGVLKLHEKSIKTGRWPARSAASAASAARSAASAAWSAARSAAASAESAAWSAARSAAASAEYEKYAKKLIELLKSA